MSEPQGFDIIVATMTATARLLIENEFLDLANGIVREDSMEILSIAADVLKKYDRETP